MLLLLVGGATFYLVVRNRPEEMGFTPGTGEETDGAGRGGDEENPSLGDGTESSLARYLGVLGNWRFLVASLAIGFQSFARYGLI
ncbi:MAG: MFS transporter, partial [Akkermansiaceae bacterium]|nr:MFS transporter [Akkermansiaceae bacterium]